MAIRGVTRPMAEQEVRGRQEDDGQHEHPMDEEGRREQLALHHRQTLWVYWSLVMLGLWLLLNPLTFGYGQGTVDPSGGRDVWLSFDQRVIAMTASDLISGLLLVSFGWRALRPGRPVSLWICCFVGIWLTLAPVIFWSPTAAGFLNGSLVGMLVIALTIMIPGMPNMIMFMAHGTTVPQGWSYNPSSWPQRFIMIATGLLGYFVSRYLAAYQLGYLGSAWDPFFGAGTTRVLDSSMSHSFPISDAALGTAAYTFEFLMGFMGSPQRWRTMPWMVTIFGILVIPLGLVHIFLVISQPVVVGSWCTFCLLAAAIMLPMIPLEVDEVVAMGQFLVQSRRKGAGLWQAFWLGGSVDGEGDDDRSPELIDLPTRPGAVLRACFWGMSVPWTLAVSAALGIALAFVPTLTNTTGSSASLLHVCGMLILTMATLAMGEPLRLIRYLNVPLGLIAFAMPWFLEGASGSGILLGSAIGLAALLLSLPCGEIREQYGAWQPFVR